MPYKEQVNLDTIFAKDRVAACLGRSFRVLAEGDMRHVHCAKEREERHNSSHFRTLSTLYTGGETGGMLALECIIIRDTGVN